MGFKDWMLRKSNVGSIARSIAGGWMAVQKQKPEATPKEIAEVIITIRYFPHNETELAKSALNFLNESVTPLELAWDLFCFENNGDFDLLQTNYDKWRQIMREEIQNMGLAPE